MKLSLGPVRGLGGARATILAGGALLAVFAACAGADEEGKDALPVIDGGAPEGSVLPDTGAPDADPDAGVDAEAIRCSGEFCLVDLPNAAVYGLSKWVFAGVVVDPQIGAWAIANGTESDEGSTSHLLHFEAGGWKVKEAVKLTAGADTRNVHLRAIASDGNGKLIAVGTVAGEPTGVVLRGDGTTFTVATLEEDLRAVWASSTSAFIAGAGGRIFRAQSDGGWANESTAAGDFLSIWGTGPGDLWVGGSLFDENFFSSFGYLGHRTVNDAGTRKWTFQNFAPPDTPYPGFRDIMAGVKSGPTSFFVTAEALARLEVDAGEATWAQGEFKPPVPLHALWARSESEIWAVGNVGRIYRFDGTTWKDAFLVFNGAPLTVQLRGIAGTSAGELFVVGDGVALRRAPQ